MAPCSLRILTLLEYCPCDSCKFKTVFVKIYIFTLVEIIVYQPIQYDSVKNTLHYLQKFLKL